MSTPTAAILIIGNEILSGKTQDANTPWIASELTGLGIRLAEVRVVRDEEAAIVDAVRALKSSNAYVFTTGGIGPTHDDITSAAMAVAFNVPLVVDAEAEKRLTDYYAAQGETLNDARRSMACVPEGAALIDNPVSAAPGFIFDNVYVMAGVPAIMRAMFMSIRHKLTGGPPMMSTTVTASVREGDVAAELEAIQNAYPDVEIGSYPGMDNGQLRVKFVLTSQDTARLSAATDETVDMARKRGGQPVVG